MNQFPRININVKHYVENYKTMSERFAPIKITPVSKCYCAYEPLIKGLVDAGVEMISDSRIENLMAIATYDVKKYLLRIPMKDELSLVVKYCDLVNVSEIDTIKWLNEEAKSQNKVIDVILMVELGDLREGVTANERDAVVKLIQESEYINLAGFGVNLTCYGAVIPTEDKMKKLTQISESYGLVHPIISGGNSSSVHLVDKNQMPTAVNQLRVGESLLLGKETAYGKTLDYMHHDIFEIEAQIIELKTKPTMPDGEIGMNAFGERITYEDIGDRERAIIALGRQDIHYEDLTPVDERISIFGSSSDHIIVDVTGLGYKVGDTLKFIPSYGAVLGAFTSKYIKKHIINV